jgi:hypothetical protein
MESFDIDADAFFEAGEKGHPTESDHSGDVPLDARQAQKMTAAARARRAHLSRYVAWVVSGATGILLLGITVDISRRHAVTTTVPHTSIAAVTTAALVEVARAPEEPQKLDEQVDDEVAPLPAHVDEQAQAVVASALPTPVPVAMPMEMTADQAKEAARAALEHGANRAAISAGERAVVMDRSDAEAWLVLGAAYQANGNVGHAKSCYDACVSHGSKGPVDECRDMLRTL